MICDFKSFLTVFRSYRDDQRVMFAIIGMQNCIVKTRLFCRTIMQGGESLDFILVILYLYSDKTRKKIVNNFFNTQQIFMR